MANVRTFAALVLAAALLASCSPKAAVPPAVIAAPPAMEASEDASDVIVTSTRKGGGELSSGGTVSVVRESPRPRDDSADRVMAPAPPPPPVADVSPPMPLPGIVPPHRPQPPRQAGILTAGDHDDLLNPALYARYVSRFLQNNNQPRLPLLDTNARIKVRVTDRNGRPAPFVRVSVARGQREPLVLTTAADGAISLFPSVDGVGQRLSLTIAPPGGTALSRTVTPTDRSVAIELPAPVPGVRKLDLLLNIDTTGSMGDELSYIKTELASIVARLREGQPNLDIRIGLLVYRDAQDDYVTRSFPFTRDISDIQASIAAQSADGGGDYPEAVDRALEDAAKFDWRPDAVKAMLFVADAPPHDARMAASWNGAMALRERGVHIVPVGASGVGDSAEYLMRSMAAVTQSRYIFLTDDSGVGLPHQDPDVPCYLVTRLNGLVGRVLAGLVSGTRIEPDSQDIIRRVGDYDKGICLPYRRPQPSRQR